jgi:hypothetical protein
LESDSIFWLIPTVGLLGLLVWLRFRKGRSSGGNAMPPGLGSGDGGGGDPGGGVTG